MRCVMAPGVRILRNLRALLTCVAQLRDMVDGAKSQRWHVGRASDGRGMIEPKLAHRPVIA
jgi:hypothetical protein